MKIVISVLIGLASTLSIFATALGAPPHRRDEAPVVYVHRDKLPDRFSRKLLNTPEKVRNFFLSQPAVQKEIKSREGKWWTQVKVFTDKKDEWVITLGNGNGPCRSPRQCHMRIRNDQTVTFTFECSDGWNCK